jgi:hypothetical protein
MVVGSNGALGQLQELGGVATSRLQTLLGSNGVGLMELVGGDKIAKSEPVRAVVEIGNVVVGRLLERAVNGKEMQALKDIGGIMLNKVVVSVQELAGQVSEGAGPGLGTRLQELGGLARDVVQNTGLASGFARMAEGAIGAVASTRR